MMSVQPTAIIPPCKIKTENGWLDGYLTQNQLTKQTVI